MKPTIAAVALLAAFSMNAVQADPDRTAPANACSTKNKSALRAQLQKVPTPDDAWHLAELLMCGARTPVNAAYLRRHMPPKIKASTFDTDGKEQVWLPSATPAIDATQGRRAAVAFSPQLALMQAMVHSKLN
ncbi:hypothetical protein [Duganella vulcania]|uniref:Uncharacterized protein n=1 Tax=Duganella vulcania TaxID=2692166 RepID=A0A845GVX1_9BURK|nr:hypothetical protein [Duganella vulcania]MYM96679.1 hypothetical protein [Duganella vulcania]